MSLEQPNTAEDLENLESDTLKISATQVDGIVSAQDADKLDIVIQTLGLNAKYPLFRVKIVAEFFLDNINECKRINCSSRQIAIWIEIAGDCFDCEAKEDAIASIKGSIEAKIEKLGADASARLVDFINNTYFKHFRLIRFCMREARPSETIDAFIPMEKFEKTPALTGAVPVTDERARAAFRRAETLNTGGTLWKSHSSSITGN